MFGNWKFFFYWHTMYQKITLSSRLNVCLMFLFWNLKRLPWSSTIVSMILLWRSRNFEFFLVKRYFSLHTFTFSELWVVICLKASFFHFHQITSIQAKVECNSCICVACSWIWRDYLDQLPLFHWFYYYVHWKNITNLLVILLSI